MNGNLQQIIPKKNYLFFILYSFLIIGFFCSLSLYYWDHFKTKNQTNIQPQQFMKMFYNDIVKNLNQEKSEESKIFLKKMISLLDYDGLEVYNRLNKMTFTIQEKELPYNDYHKIPFIFPQKKASPWKFVFLKRNHPKGSKDLKNGPLSFNLLIFFAIVSIIHLTILIWKNIIRPTVNSMTQEFSSQNVSHQLLQNSKIVSEYSQKIIILIDQNLNILNPQSQFAYKIFQQNIENHNVIDFFFKRFNISGNKINKIESSLALIFGDDTIQYNAVNSHLPKQSTIGLGKSIKSFNFFYIPLLNKNNQVEKIVISLNQNTEIKILRKTIFSLQQKTKILEDLNGIENKEKIYGSLIKIKSLLTTQITTVLSKCNSDFDPSFKVMFFYELSKITPDIPFFKAFICENKTKLEKKLNNDFNPNDLLISNDDYNFTKDLITTKYLFFLEFLSQTASMIKHYNSFNDDLYDPFQKIDEQLSPIFKSLIEDLKEILEKFFTFFNTANSPHKLDLKTLSKCVKQFPNFQETLKILKLKSILLSLLSTAVNNDSNALFFKNVSSQLNLVFSRDSVDDYILKNNLLGPFYMLNKKINELDNFQKKMVKRGSM